MPAIRALSVAYIEFIRGVPLITVLFMASVMLPLFLPRGHDASTSCCARRSAFILFSRPISPRWCAAGCRRSARPVRGGDGAGPGLLAQDAARRSCRRRCAIAIPPLVGTFIGGFKDTALVSIVGLFDLLQDVAVGISDPSWRGVYVEGYAFVAAIYFVFCYAHVALQPLARGPQHDRQE